MATKIQDGKYTAAPVSAAVYEKNNKLVLECTFALTDESGVAYEPKIERNKKFWLTNNAGAVNTKVFDQIKKFAPAWDGTDPYWFTEGDNFASVGLVEVDIQTRPYTNGQGETVNWQDIEWVNPIGSGGSRQPVHSADKASIMAKYGAMFKAANPTSPKPVSASSLSKPTPAAPVRKPAPVAPARPTTSAAKYPPGLEGQAKVWDDYCAKCEGNVPNNARDDAWFNAIDAAAPGKDQQDFTAEEWTAVAKALSI